MCTTWYHCETCAAQGHGPGPAYGHSAVLGAERPAAAEGAVQAGAMEVFVSSETRFLASATSPTTPPPLEARPALTTAKTERHRARQAARLRDAARGTHGIANFVPRAPAPAMPRLPDVGATLPSEAGTEAVDSETVDSETWADLAALHKAFLEAVEAVDSETVDPGTWADLAALHKALRNHVLRALTEATAAVSPACRGNLATLREPALKIAFLKRIQEQPPHPLHRMLHELRQSIRHVNDECAGGSSDEWLRLLRTLHVEPAPGGPSESQALEHVRA